MGTPILTSATTVICGHAGSTNHVPGQVRVKVAGSIVAVATDQHVVAGCSLASSSATFCTVLMWSAPATRVKAGGKPVLLNSSICTGVGPGTVVPGQIRVSGQ